MKSIVVRFILASFLIWILLCIVILYTQYQNSIFDFYSIKIRPYFFTAFLTAGSLILTLKFNILFNIKEKLYNDKKYIEILNEYKKINSNYSKFGRIVGSMCFGLFDYSGKSVLYRLYPLLVGIRILYCFSHCDNVHDILYMVSCVVHTKGMVPDTT